MEILNVLTIEYESLIERVDNVKDRDNNDSKDNRKIDLNLLQKDFSELKGILIEKDGLIAKLKIEISKLREDSLQNNRNDDM